MQSLIPNLFLLYLVVTNVGFVWWRLDAYREMTGVVAVAQEAGADNVLFVNLPQWIAPPRNDFAVGAEFVAQLGDYLFVDELGRANGVAGQVQAVRVPDLLADFGYGYAVHEQTALADVVLAGETAVVITKYGEEGVWAENAGIFHPPTTFTPPIATFANYQLLDVTVQQCNGTITATLTWQLEGQPSPTHTMFAQAIGTNGLVAQSDAPPLQLRSDLLTVPANWEMVDIRRMVTDERAETFLLGVYDYVTGERMPAFSPNNQPLPDNALTLPITRCTE